MIFRHVRVFVAIVMASLLWTFAAIAQEHQHTMPGMAAGAPIPTERPAASPEPDEKAPAADSGQSASAMPMSSHAPVIFTLRTGIAEGRMVYIRVGGDIDRQVNPTLMIHEGETVQINLINGEGAQHDVVIDQYAARSAIVNGKNASSIFSFVASKVGEFDYYCSIPGHRQAGMQGLIQVMPGSRAEMQSSAADITRDPADLPPPIGARQPQTVRVDLETVESRGNWTTRQPIPTGHSTERCPVPSCASASATRSRCI
jgi:nitrite reductase (NO-forming)